MSGLPPPARRVLAVLASAALIAGAACAAPGAAPDGAEGGGPTASETSRSSAEDEEALSASPATTQPVGPVPNPFGGDPTWIAYQTQRSGDEGVWLIHPDGTKDHHVMTDLPNALLPDWSPDGKHLAVTTRGGETEPLYEFNLADGTSQQLFRCDAPCLGDDEPAYSPDGSKVAFIRYLAPFVDDAPSDCSLWIGERATGKVRRVTDNGSGCDREYMPRWSPDGTRMTYWRQPSADGRTSITAVFVVDADGTGERRLTKPAMEAGEPDWSPDGEWIVFASHPLAQFDSGESHLYRVHPDGSGMERLTAFSSADLRATQPRYSPDGEWIVFTAATPSTRSLWAIPSDGGEPVVIANGGIYTHGTWQPHD